MKVSCCDRCLAKKVVKYAPVVYRRQGLGTLNYCLDCVKEGPPNTAEDHMKIGLAALDGLINLSNAGAAEYKTLKAQRKAG